MGIYKGDNTNNIINGNVDADFIYGYAGNDTLNGWGGDDTLIGGLGNDYLYGDRGADTYLFSKGDGMDTVNPYDNTGIFDTIKFIDVASTDVVSIYDDNNHYNNLVIQYGNGDQISIEHFFANAYIFRINEIQFTDKTWNFAYLRTHHNGTDNNDLIRGFSDEINTINGLGGDDTIYGGDKGDMLNGGSGNDDLRGGLGADTYLFSKGGDTDIVYDGQINKIDTIKFTDVSSTEVNIYDDNNLVIEYGNGDKVNIYNFFGVSATTEVNKQIQFTDTIWTLTDIAAHHNGTDDDDYLDGFKGLSNTINGLDGDDFIKGADNNDHLNGGKGIDTVVYTNIANAVNVNLITGIATGDGIDTLSGFENILGSNYDDTLTGNNSNNFINGVFGNDTLNGLGGDDILKANGVLNGGNGNDQLEGIGILNGGNGDDQLSGDGKLKGGNGNDILLGSGILNGGDGNDAITGSYGQDILMTGNGADVVIGGQGKDKIILTEDIQATDDVIIGVYDSLVFDFFTGRFNQYDKIVGFTLGNGKVTAGIDRLDLNTISIEADIMGFDGVNSGIVHSHKISNGAITFDDVDDYSNALTLSENNLVNVFKYLQSNISDGGIVAFTALNNTYVFQDDGLHDGGAVSTLIQLNGISATNLNTDGLAAGGIWLL